MRAAEGPNTMTRSTKERKMVSRSPHPHVTLHDLCNGRVTRNTLCGKPTHITSNVMPNYQGYYAYRKIHDSQKLYSFSFSLQAQLFDISLEFLSELTCSSSWIHPIQGLLCSGEQRATSHPPREQHLRNNLTAAPLVHFILIGLNSNTQIFGGCKEYYQAFVHLRRVHDVSQMTCS